MCKKKLTKTLKSSLVIVIIFIASLIKVNLTSNDPFLMANSEGTCYCDSCESCNTALNDISCSTIKLNQNVSSAGTCLAGDSLENKVIDCQDYEIGYAESAVEKGIYFTNSSNISIQSCRLEQKSELNGTSLSESPSAIYFNNVNTASVEKSSILVKGVHGRGIIIFDTTNSTINDNDIETLGDRLSMGILLFSSTDNHILENNIKTNGSQGTSFGIAMNRDSSDNIISNNIVETNGGFGITGQNDSLRNEIIDNTIATNNSRGITFHTGSNSNIVSGNNVTAFGGDIGLWVRTDSNNLHNNTIITSGQEATGLTIDDSAKNNTFVNITITTSGDNAHGILFPNSTGNNNFSDISLTTELGHGIYFQSGSHSANFTDSTITSRQADDLKIDSLNNELNLTNTTTETDSPLDINWPVGVEGTLNVYWHLDVSAENEAGKALKEITVEILDDQENLKFSGQTDSSGSIPTQTLLEYSQINGGEKNYSQNYNVKSLFEDVIEEEELVVLNESKKTIFILGFNFLTIDSSSGGEVLAPGEGEFRYLSGDLIALNANPDKNYLFDKWTGDIEGIEDVNLKATTVLMNNDYSIKSNFKKRPSSTGLFIPPTPQNTAGEIIAIHVSGGKTSLTDSQGVKVEVNVPPHAVNVNTVFKIVPTDIRNLIKNEKVEPFPEEWSMVGDKVYQINALNIYGHPITNPLRSIDLNFTYPQNQVLNLDEASLKIYFWNKDKWEALTSINNPVTKKITASTDLLSYFVIAGQKQLSMLPINKKVDEEKLIEIIPVNKEIGKEKIVRMSIVNQDKNELSNKQSCFINSFERSLRLGAVGDDVKCLQIILNTIPKTNLAATEAGSPGLETNYFGPLTEQAVIKFQEKYSLEILSPWGIDKGTGFVGITTRKKLNEIYSKAFKP